MSGDTLRVLPSIISVLMFCAQGAMILIIKLNDFKHLEKGFAEIQAQLKAQNEHLGAYNERLARLEGGCAARQAAGACSKKE